MVDSYNMGQGYPQGQTYPQFQQQYAQNQIIQGNKPYINRGPSVLGIAGFGAVAGATVGYFRNNKPVSKNGVVSDTFAKKVFEEHLNKNVSDGTKTYLKQVQDVLKKLNKVKTTDDFKSLINSNKSVFEDSKQVISNQNMVEMLGSNNLKKMKLDLEKKLKGIVDYEMTKTKNAIELAWNKETKKFVKTDAFKDEKLFKIIEKTTTSGKWKRALKYGGITAGVLGALTIGYKLLTGSTNRN